MFTFWKPIVVMVAVAASFATVSPATAAAYPEPTAVQIDIDLSASTLIGGADLVVTATATAGEETPEGTLEVEAFGETFSDDQSTLKVQVTVETPVVTQKEVHKIVATFTPNNTGNAAGAATSKVITAVYKIGSSSVVSAAFAPATASENVTLLPTTADDDDNGGGVLPDTGGTAFWFLILGAVLLALGAAVLEVQRRRRATHAG